MKRQKEKINTCRPKAVVVNDDPTQIKVLAGLLNREGIGVTAYEGAEAALGEMNTACPPDLIVTDLYMPGIDGWRFCRLLRSPEYEAFNTVPILVVSATFAGDEASRITADLGANAFMSSPVDGCCFIDTVRAVCSGKKAKESLRVLVVEDSRTQAGLVAKRFEAHGYQVDVAFSCGEAMMCFADAVYDIAVLDYYLPDGLGDGLLDEFQGRNPDCVFVMMTADPNPRLSLSWMKAGAAAYLRKPFDPEYLIEQCIRARRERALLRVKDLLEERTKDHRILLDTIDTQVWYLKDIETYGRLNRSHAEFLGFDITDIAHKRLEEFVSKSVANACRASNIEVFQTRKPVYSEEWIPNADGEERLIAITKTPNLDAKGNVEYVVCAGTDITERKRAEEKLADTKQRLKYILDGTNTGNWEWNVQTGQTVFNERWAKIIGYTLDEISPVSIETWMKFCHPDDLAESERLLKECFEGKTEYYIHECRMKHRDGSWVWVLDRGKVFTWTLDGKPEWMFGSHQDITERVRLQQKLQMLEKNKSLERMAGSIAHLFNNHLAVISGNLELLADDLQPGDRGYKNLKEAQTAAHRAAETSGFMLTLLGQIQGKSERLDLAQACRQRLAGLETDRPVEAEIICDLPDSGPVIHLDRSHLDEIIDAIVTNAWESLDKAGEVRVSVYTASAFDISGTHRFPLDWEPDSEKYACLRVADTGCGMDETTICRIFDPFYTDKFTGRGLGLPVILGIIKYTKGCVTVESRPGQGSVFQVFLPISMH